MGQLRDSLSLGPKQRHPVLMNAVYLWACFVSRPEPLCQHEEHYLRQALIALPEALRLQNKVIDVIQASCLLSLYFLSTGRLLEGGYHANAAAALAMQIGLGRNSFLEAQNFLLNGCTETDLKPSKFDIQEGERILTFWQVYNLDRCWSVVLRKPCIIHDGPDLKNAIHCPWPQEIADYEIVSFFFLPWIVTVFDLVMTHRAISIPILIRCKLFNRSWPGLCPPAVFLFLLCESRLPRCSPRPIIS